MNCMKSEKWACFTSITVHPKNKIFLYLVGCSHYQTWQTESLISLLAAFSHRLIIPEFSLGRKGKFPPKWPKWPKNQWYSDQKGIPKSLHTAKTLPDGGAVELWKQVCALKGNCMMRRVRKPVIPVSGLMFGGCVVGAGLLREWAWTGGPVIGCWAARSWERRGSCQVVDFSRWLQTHNKSKHICVC